MKLGVIGPRDFQGVRYENHHYVGKVLDQYCRLHKVSEVISGGGKGVETIVKEWCDKTGLACLNVLPNIKLYGQQEAFVFRNEKILKECDMLMLFWDGANSSAIKPISGAMELLKPVLIIPMV